VAVATFLVLFLTVSSVSYYCIINAHTNTNTHMCTHTHTHTCA